MTRSRLRRTARVATVMAIALILYLTLTPSPPGSGPLPSQLGHLLMFALLGAALALWYATSDAARRSPRAVLLAVLLVIALLALGTEVAQGATDDRQPSILDAAANLLGGMAGLLGGSFIARTILERERR